MAKFVLTYGTQGGTVGIEVFKPSSLVAPAQIWLEAVDHAGLAAFEENGSVYNGAHHEYYHEWTINGEPLSEWGKPTNLLAAHNNPNKAFGRKVSFCLPDPGSYVIDLVVTDRMGNTAVASTGTVIVFDPESYFPPADRIYVDPDGDFTGVPAASERVVSLEDLRVTMGSRTVNPTWVLLRRGKEHPLEGVDALNSNDNFKGCLYFDQFNEVKLISGYGSGANPVVTPDSRADRSPNNSMFKLVHPKTGDWRTVSGIDFRGERSAATEHGFGPYSGGPVFGGWRREDGFSLIHDCTVSGLINGFSPGGADLAHAPEGRHYQMFADCACDEWRAMGVHGGSPGMHLSLTGTRLVQNVNAPNNGGKDGIRSNHGPIRISDCKYLYISGCDLFSRTFWDGADQPCLRMFTSGQVGQDGGVVERCTMEGGYQVVQMNSSDGGVLHPINVVYERLFLVASTYTTTFLDTARSGVTFRDNVLVRSNVPVLVASGNGEIQFRIEEPQSTGAGLYDEPIAIYGNTALNLLTDANDGVKDYPMVFIEGGANGTYFTNVVEENNVYHRPVGGEVVDTYAPIDTTTATAGFDPRYLGRQYNFDHHDFVLDQDYEVGEILEISYSTIGDGLYEGTPSTGPTDQAYWLAVPDIEHELIIESFGGRSRRGYSETWGHINVTFGATEVTVENTSGETWLNGATARLWLDRSSLMPEMDDTYANPATIPLPRPQTGSAAIGAATAGRISPKDFLLTDRGETPSRGALEPA